MSSARIFISYRRADSAGWAGRLHDDLRERFGADRVFRDVAITPGVDFIDHIEGVMDGCEVLLAVIGPRWATVTGPSGRPRLHAPDDLVRLEIERALRRPDVHVVPVLVEGAAMPPADDLPEGLRALSRRNAMEITDQRWEYDVERLCDCLRSVLGESMVWTTVAPPAEAATEPSPPAPGSQAPTMASVLVASAGLAGILGAVLTSPLAEARGKGDIEGSAPWSGQWLGEVGERLGLYAAQRAIVWVVVAAAVLGALAAVRRRARAPGSARGGLLGGLSLGVLAGLADAAIYITLRHVAEWEQLLCYSVSVAVAGAVVGAVVARAVGGRSTGVAALAAVGGGFLAGLASKVSPINPLDVALQAALVVGAAATVALLPDTSGPAADPAAIPPDGVAVR